MARKRKRTEINLTIDFGKRIYNDESASMYEAKDNVSGNKLLVFFTEEKFVTHASGDIAKEIRRICDKINMASIEVPFLCPILESGLSEMNQAFFMSNRPDADPLIMKEYDSVESVLEQMKSVFEVISIVHSLGLNQYICNLRSEWFIKQDGSLVLVFPGVRGLLKRVQLKNADALQVDVESDVLELCTVFEKLLKQLSVDSSSEKISITEARIATLKKHYRGSTLASFRDFLSDIAKEIAEVKEVSSILSRQTSAPTMMYQAPRDSEDNGESEDNDYGSYGSSNNKYKDDQSVLSEDETDDFGYAKRDSSYNMQEDSDYQSDFVDLKSQGKNMFADILKDLGADSSNPSGAYEPPKVEVFGGYAKETPRHKASQPVANRFSDIADEVYGETTKKSLGDIPYLAGIDDSRKRNLLLFGLVGGLVLIILVIVIVIFSYLFSGGSEDRKKPDSIALFDDKDSNVLTSPERDTTVDQVGSSVSEGGSSELQKFPELDESVFRDEDNAVESHEAESFNEENRANNENMNVEKNEDDVGSVTFNQGSTSEHVDEKTFLDTLASPIPEKEVSRIISFLESDDFDVRIAAVRALGEKAPKGDMRTKIAIESMLNDGDALVRGFAAFALVSYIGNDAIPILEDQRKYEKNEVVTSAIQRALAKLKTGNKW